MSMLAEPRRKKRYNLTPKGKPLFEDNDRFGTKMLQKMGWSKGKGLGKSEDGTQDFVRVKYKSDERGIGYQVRDDQWTEHDKNFNGLLENLNGGTSACPEDCEIIKPSVGLGFVTKSSNKKKLKDKISGQSLEENSKKSKARVHYKKFTKGKDMSQYSEKDLANIFGKKATTEETNIYSQFQAFNAAESDSGGKEEAEEECVQENPKNTGTPIINTGVSINDYFKEKMAALMEKEANRSSNPFQRNIRKFNNVDVVNPSAKRKRSTDSEVLVVEEEKVSLKKEKTETPEVVNFSQINQTTESVKSEEDRVPRKNKKSKKLSIEGEETDSVTKMGGSEIIALVDVTAEEAHKEEEKCQKVAGSNGIEIDASYEHENSEESNFSKKKKKSKKVKNEKIKNGEHIEIPYTSAEDEAPKKKKNKDKKKTSGVNDSDETENSSSLREENFQESRTQNIEETPMQEENIKSTNSKKKKNKTITPNTTVEAEVSSHQKDLNSLTKEDIYLQDKYTISKFCAEKFRNVEAHHFQGSNLMDLNGYGLSTKLKLDIQNIFKDDQRIIRLWSGTLDKYTHSTSKHKIYSSYIDKMKLAKQSKQKIPALKLKSLKRKHIFQCV